MKQIGARRIVTTLRQPAARWGPRGETLCATPSAESAGAAPRTSPPASSPLRSARAALAWSVIVAALVVGAALAPWVAAEDRLTLLVRMCLLVTLAQSWNILAGLAGQTSLGHAAFFGAGALVTRTLWLDGLPFPAALALGGLSAAAFALLIGFPTFRLRGAAFAIGTLAVAEVLRLTVAQRWPLITSLPSAEILRYDLAVRYELALGLALAATGTAAVLRRSPLGLGLAAVREDEEAARATGVGVLAHKLLALALASLFAGLAGGLFAYQQGATIRQRRSARPGPSTPCWSPMSAGSAPSSGRCSARCSSSWCRSSSR